MSMLQLSEYAMLVSYIGVVIIFHISQLKYQYTVNATVISLFDYGKSIWQLSDIDYILL